MTNLSERFFDRGCKFLDVEYPILCGAMTWISDANLVAAVSNAGGFGCLAGGNAPAKIFADEIRKTRDLTDKSFAVNLITIAPAFQEQLKVAEELKPKYVIFAGSFPKKAEVERVKAMGAKVLCFASTASIARRMSRFGADAIVIEGTEAGGHIGQVSLTILLQQILFEVQDIPVFVAGGIATGKLAAHLLLMGAAGVQLGTRFAIAKESRAHADFKKKFITANARDAVTTAQFDSRLPIVGVRALRNQGVDNFGQLQLQLLEKINKHEIHREEAQVELENFWMGALRRAVEDGDIDNGSLMAGQSVGLVDREQPVAEIINELVTEIEEELVAVRQRLQ